jgi:hypothetical protein
LCKIPSPLGNSKVSIVQLRVFFHIKHSCIFGIFRTLKQMWSYSETLEKTLLPGLRGRPQLLGGNPILSLSVY